MNVLKNNSITYLGMAAIQVLYNSIFGSTLGFRSPLKDNIGHVNRIKLGEEKRNKKMYQATENRSVIKNNTNAATSSGSLWEQCGFVIIMGLPTWASNALMMLSSAFRMLKKKNTILRLIRNMFSVCLQAWGFYLLRRQGAISWQSIAFKYHSVADPLHW